MSEMAEMDNLRSCADLGHAGHKRFGVLIVETAQPTRAAMPEPRQYSRDSLSRN
jgi:hypothetical protein